MCAPSATVGLDRPNFREGSTIEAEAIDRARGHALRQQRAAVAEAGEALRPAADRRLRNLAQAIALDSLHRHQAL